MSSQGLSAMPLRSALLRLSPIILAMGAFLLPAQAQTFSSSGSISIPNSDGTTGASPYPTSPLASCTNAACIAVSGLTGTYTSMSITLSFSSLNNESFTSPAFLLESPSGAKLDILSFACAYELSPTTVTFTLKDDASNGLFPPAYNPDSLDCPSGLPNSSY
ncbi:MAG TPA: hypothetical protein VE178_09225, partial [Silvibacterium sp.]|nr:hypothetical protein [Silvibacterium sp.]